MKLDTPARCSRGILNQWRTATISLLIAGCGEAADRAPASPGTTGTGVLTEELRIDGHEQRLVPFPGLAGGSVAVARNGTIAFIQAQDHQVRFYSEGGEPLGSFGSAGQGPGEFVALSRLGWLGDSLWVFDIRLRRITLIDAERRLVRTFRSPPYARPAPEEAGRVPGSEYLIPHAVSADGSVTALVLPMWGEGSAEFVNRNLFASVAPDGTMGPVLAAVDVDPEGEYLRDGRGGSMGRPFGHASVSDVSRDGEVVVWARGDVDGDPHLRVTAVRIGGDTVFARSYPFEPVVVPPAVLDSVLDPLAQRWPQYRSQLLQMKEEGIVYPPVQEMVAGRDGTVWLALADRDGGRPYLVLDRRGEPIGRVSLPIRSRVAEAERGRVWVVEPDEFDVESLVRYAVRW